MSNPPPAPTLLPHCNVPCPGPVLVLTPGMISALPSSRHSATLALICSRTSDLISPVSPAGGGVSETRQGSRAGGWTKMQKDGTPGTEGRETKPGVAARREGQGVGDAPERQHRGREEPHSQMEKNRSRQTGMEEEGKSHGHGGAVLVDGRKRGAARPPGAGGEDGWASPEKRARKPWVRELMTSISCRDTVCTTSLRFWSSPSGHCTNLVYGAGVGFSVDKGRKEHEVGGPKGPSGGDWGSLEWNQESRWGLPRNPRPKR